MVGSEQTRALRRWPGRADTGQRLWPSAVSSTDVFISYLIARQWLWHLRFLFWIYLIMLRWPCSDTFLFYSALNQAEFTVLAVSAQENLLKERWKHRFPAWQSTWREKFTAVWQYYILICFFSPFFIIWVDFINLFSTILISFTMSEFMSILFIFSVFFLNVTCSWKAILAVIQWYRYRTKVGVVVAETEPQLVF